MKFDGYVKKANGRFTPACICVCTHLHFAEVLPMGVEPSPTLVAPWCPCCDCEEFIPIRKNERVGVKQK